MERAVLGVIRKIMNSRPEEIESLLKYIHIKGNGEPKDQTFYIVVYEQNAMLMESHTIKIYPVYRWFGSSDGYRISYFEGDVLMNSLHKKDEHGMKKYIDFKAPESLHFNMNKYIKGFWEPYYNWNQEDLRIIEDKDKLAMENKLMEMSRYGERSSTSYRQNYRR